MYLDSNTMNLNGFYQGKSCLAITQFEAPFCFKTESNYNAVVKKCHSTVGIAILNTSITIVFGFSILVLSNFIPTIYFGIFTGIAMLLAMFLVLTLLPSLILLIKPFGIKENA